MEDRAKICELCAGAPDVYCNSDDAFLCFNCDARVHQANFLVSRHLRLLLCRTCRCLTQNSVFGPRSLPHSAACAACSSSEVESVSSEQEMDSISCCSSSNPSESGSSTAKFPIRCDVTVDQRQGPRSNNAPPRSGACEGKIGAVFANWCRKVGVEADLVEPRAVQAMGLLSAGRIGRVLPLRLSLAAAFWFGARLSGDRSRQSLRRLAHVSGVPAELIVSVEAKLEQGFKGRGRSLRRPEPEEGWAESVV
ncbi:unnamed protein product [Linum tenue]|uniref:B box-type domain-containing protein n=1 Tax=Linum tenue TaxID=586396 RepID=A0AAV0JJI2_9ROSI|nr:unnamed protein product [Linum tenue]